MTLTFRLLTVDSRCRVVAAARESVSPTVLLAQARLSAICRCEKPASFNLSTSMILRIDNLFLGTAASRLAALCRREGTAGKAGPFSWWSACARGWPP